MFLISLLLKYLGRYITTDTIHGIYLHYMCSKTYNFTLQLLFNLNILVFPWNLYNNYHYKSNKNLRENSQILHRKRYLGY
jgi:hypothetical protein